MSKKLINQEEVREIIRQNTRAGSRQELYRNMEIGLFNRICSFVAGKYGVPYDQNFKVYALDEINPEWVMEQFLESYPEFTERLDTEERQLVFALICKSCERQINIWYKEIRAMAAADFTKVSITWNLEQLKGVSQKKLDKIIKDYIAVCKKRTAKPIKLMRY